MRALTYFLLLVGLVVTACADVNVTGKWSGSFLMTSQDGETHEGTALLVLKQEGNEITGTVGPNEEERLTIKTGKIEGNKITLEIRDDEHNRSMKFDLALEGERIKGQAALSGADGEKRSAKIDVSREK